MSPNTTPSAPRVNRLFGCLALHNAEGRTDQYTASSIKEIREAILNANSLLKKEGTLLIDMITGDTCVYRKNLGHINETFWDAISKEDPLSNYSIIFKGCSSDGEERIIFWAKKN